MLGHRVDFKRITFLITDLDYGGAEVQVLRLVRHLKSRGWDVNLISILPPDAFEQPLREIGISVVSLLPSRTKLMGFVAVWKLLDILKTWNPGILVSFMYHANILGRIVGRLLGVPIIVSSIRNERYGGIWRDFVMRLTSPLDTLATTNSRIVAEKLLDRKIASEDKIRVVPNAIDVDLFLEKPQDETANLRADLGINESVFVWLTVGRLERQKGYPTLLRALAKVVANSRNLRLLVAGRGQLESELHLMVKKYGIEEYVDFLGLRLDIPELMSISDAFVLGSVWEGLPNAVAEASAAAKPIVCTNVGGIPELVLDGRTGFLVKPRDSEALALAMLRVMQMSKTLRTRMGERGREYITDNYASEKVLNQWERLLMDVDAL